MSQRSTEPLHTLTAHSSRRGGEAMIYFKCISFTFYSYYTVHKMLTINFINALPSTQSITAEDKCSKALASIKRSRKKKNTPAFCCNKYRQSSYHLQVDRTPFRQGLSQDDLCFQLGIMHIWRSKQLPVSFNYNFYIYWNCVSCEK